MSFVKPGSRFSHRPEEWRQRVCHQKSCHEQSPECAASLGLQTLAGIVHLSFLLFLFSLSFYAFAEGKQHFCCNDIVVLQDFELNTELKMRVIGFLEEVMHDPELLTQERKAAANIIRFGFCYRRLIAHTVIYDASVCLHPVEKKVF